jgi:hypothetical protein
MQGEYLKTAIIAKAATLDTGSSDQVQKFNDLLKRYYNNVFFVTDVSDKEEDITKDNIDEKLKGFRGLFKGKSLGNLSKKGTDIKDEDFSNINIKDMGNYTE